MTCTPQHTDGNAPGNGYGYIGISNVTIGTINNTTGYYNNNPSYNYYSTLSTDVEIGETYELKVTYKDDGNPYNPGAIGVWVDWNEDGDFSDTNEFIEVKNSVANNSVNTFSIPVPAGTAEGTKRLRVRSVFNSEDLTSGDACTIKQYGETEDYNLIVISSAGKPKNVKFHNYGGTEQLAFNNSRIETASPTFRMSHETYDANAYEVQIANNTGFTGAVTQTFNGTYALGTEANFKFTNAFTPVNNTTYYVRARVRGAAGVWSAWSTETYSFTYQTPREVPGWFQTTRAQFQTDALSGLNANGADDVVVAGGGGNVIVNGTFANTSGWTTYRTNGTGALIDVSSTDCFNCPSGTTRNLKMYLYSASVLNNDMLIVSQQVDLTNVDQITYNANSYYSPNGTNPGGAISNLRFIIGGSSNNETGTVMHTTNQAYCATYCTNQVSDQNITINTSGYTGVHTIKFVVKFTATHTTGGLLGFYVNNVVASASPTGTITSTPIHFASVQDAENYKEVKWNQTLGEGTLNLKVQGSSNGSTWADISGHTNISEAGNGEKTHDLSDINPATYPHLRLVGTLDGSGVKLHDWAVEFKKEEVVLDCESTTTYAGGSWSNGYPTASPKKLVIIEDDFTVNSQDLIACSLKVRNGAKLTVNSGFNLWVDEEVEVDNSTHSELTLKNNANLFQVNDLAVNEGKIKVEKEFIFSGAVPAQRQYNFVSIPVEDFILKGSANNAALYAGMTYVLKYNEATDYFVNATNDDHIPGKGFAIKEGDGSGSVIGQFVGVPFNGEASITLDKTTQGQGFNVIGNPYPSTLDLVQFYNDNKDSGVFEKADFYFWDNRLNNEFEQLGSDYTNQYQNNHSYANFNAASGPAGTGNRAPSMGADNSKIPTRYLKPGTGFMVQAKANKPVTFNNAQRKAGAGPSFTGKTTQGTDGSVESVDRYWLLMNTPVGLAYSTAIVYFEGGNNGYWIDDSDAFGSSDELYSLTDNQQVIIQGKEPFAITDVVPMGFRAFKRGNYSIAISDKEGVFANGQKIYLRDKDLGVTHDFNQGAYSFKTQKGEFNNRFEIVYKPNKKASLNSLAEVANVVHIQKVNQQIEVKSSLDKIVEVEIFNLSGRSIVKANNIHELNWTMPTKTIDKQILVVVVKTETGEVITQKVITK